MQQQAKTQIVMATFFLQLVFAFILEKRGCAMRERRLCNAQVVRELCNGEQCY